MAEVNLTPELRFPEFEGEWKNQTLFEVAKITTGNTPSTSKQEYYNGEFFFVSPADLNDGRYVVRTQTTLSELGFNSGRRISKGSTLFVSIGSTIGKVGQTVCDVITNQQINALEANELNSDDFIYSLLFKYGPKIRLLAGNQAVPILNKTDFSNLKFFFPEKEEQQKIASFLTAIDERIQLLQQKKAKLEEYKKGVMQQLFSQQIRFKDENGNDFPDWEEKKLGNVFNSKKGTGLSKSVLDSEGQFDCILYGELYTTYAEVIFEVVSKTNEEGGTLSKHGDLLVPCSTTTSAIDLANVTALNKDNVRLGGDITILRARKNTNNIFYAYYLSNFKKLEIAKYGQGTTIVHLYYNHFKVMTIDVPSIEEQIKIANFLTSLDGAIESLAKELEGTTTFKKGLLQKMFV